MPNLVSGLADDRNRSLFYAGVRDLLPIQIGIFPLGVIVGLTAVELGFTTAEITVMSITVFAGAAQLAAVFLMADGVHITIVVATAVLINMRFVMYSATLAPIFQSYSRVRKTVYAYLLVDPPYALSMPRFQARDDGRTHWYYFAGGLTMWISWILGTILGAGLGISIPETFPVNLVLPLVFLSLLFPVIEDRSTAVAALVAAVGAILAAPLPHNLGLLVGIFCGLLAGVYLNR